MGSTISIQDLGTIEQGSDFRHSPREKQTAQFLYCPPRRVSTARKYEEQEKGAEGAGGGGSCVTKRSRSRSPRKGSSPGADGSHPKRSRWGGEEGERKRRSSSPSRERRQGSHQPPRASDGVSLTEEAVVDADTPPGKEALAGQTSRVCQGLMLEIIIIFHN